jgi:hypothetical protein
VNDPVEDASGATTKSRSRASVAAVAYDASIEAVLCREPSASSVRKCVRRPAEEAAQ